MSDRLTILSVLVIVMLRGMTPMQPNQHQAGRDGIGRDTDLPL